MCSLNSEGDRRMQAVFDEIADIPRSDQAIFFAGFYGNVMSLVMLRSVADDRFVGSIEDWLAQVKKMSVPK